MRHGGFAMKKNDFILLMTILILSLSLFIGYRFFFSRSGDYVTITVDGEIYKSLPLDEDTELTIKGTDGGANHLEIKKGAARITDADCPDKLCVHQKKIENQGETLVCLPHKVIVQVSSDKKGDLDDVAN